MSPKKVIIAKFLFLCFLFHTYANENYNPIFLFDGNSNFGILKSLYENKFFNAFSTSPQYITSLNYSNLHGKGITITSSITNIEGNNTALYSILGFDGRNRQYRINWQLDKNSSLTEEALNMMLDIAMNSHKSSISETLFNDFINKNDIFNFTVRYNAGKVDNEIFEYSATLNINPSSFHYFWRTIIELTILNSFGLINYFVNKDANIVDWEYQPNSEGFKRKFMDGWSLDTNNFRTNSLYHIYAGIIYYQTARSNNYGPLASFVWCFIGSTFWEYIGEYREQVSTNDQIFTPMGGVIFGEGLRQLGLYVERSMQPGIMRYFLCFILDPMRIINRQLDRWFGNEFNFNIQFLNPTQTIISEAVIPHLRR